MQSFTFKHRTTPLFVNSSQMQEYSCSPHVATAVIPDDSADRWNIFNRFSASPSMDVAAEQSSVSCVSDTESCCKPGYNRDASTPVSPIFNKQILQHAGQFSLKDDSIRNVKKDSALTTQLPVDFSSKSSSLSNAEDRDCDSPLFTIRSCKRRHRQVLTLIDSDSSDSDVEVCESSDHGIYNKSHQNAVVAKGSIHRLSALEHRHCFDLLLNCESHDTVKNSDIAQCLQSGHNEQRNDDMYRHSANSFQPLFMPFDGKIVKRSDIAGKVGVSSVSSSCCIHLRRLQLHDVPSRILLSREDKRALSGRCSPEVSDQTSTAGSDSELQTSNNFTRLTGGDANCGSAVQSSNVQYNSSEDLFSDDELVESVCLSPSFYCKYKDDGECDVGHVSTHSGKSLESAAAREESEVPSLHYSQVEDDCILISDSDDDLFANLTQSDITIKVEYGQGEQSETDSTVDGSWLGDDADSVAASDHAGERSVALEECDPWIDDVADVSSDELEEAYNAALICAVPAKGHDFDSTCSAGANSRQLRTSDENAVISVSAVNQSSTCSVVLKPLRFSDVPPDVHLREEQKHICEHDGDDSDNEETDADSYTDTLSNVPIRSMSCEVKSDTECMNGEFNDEDVASAVDVLKSSDLAGFADCEKLASSGTSTKHRKEPDSSAAVVNESYQTSSKCGIFDKINKLSSIHDTGKVVENVDIGDKKSRSARVALEDCLEVAEFYGTSMTATSKEKKKLRTVNHVRDVDKLADTKSVNSTGLLSAKKEQLCSTATATSHVESQKFDRVKQPEDDSDCREEEWKSKASMEATGKTTFSVQYQRIAQMHDYNKQKLRKDKTSTSCGRRLQADPFQGLSQFSVAKQQLVKRNRQLKTNGLYNAICQSNIPYVS